MIATNALIATPGHVHLAVDATSRCTWQPSTWTRTCRRQPGVSCGSTWTLDVSDAVVWSWTRRRNYRCRSVQDTLQLHRAAAVCSYGSVNKLSRLSHGFTRELSALQRAGNTFLRPCSVSQNATCISRWTQREWVSEWVSGVARFDVFNSRRYIKLE